MFLCPKCQEMTEFVQVKNEMRRKIVIQINADGSTSRRPSAWRTEKVRSAEGIFCAKCHTQLLVPQKLLTSLKLDDQPPPKPDLAKVRVAPTIEKLSKVFPNTDINTYWYPEDSKKGTRSKLDGDKLGIPETLLERVEEAHGISKDSYYCHQVEAITQAIDGQNVVIQTSTSSGKTHCYLVPVFSELIKNPESTALFIFPTKALSYDQIIKITSIGEDFSPDDLDPEKKLYAVSISNRKIFCGKYDRDTETEIDKSDVRKKARIVITNPDALHFKILPHIRTKAGSFEPFFRNLRYVVLDEIHAYRGAFGANVALLMRRLRLLCLKLGNSELRFICCSATVPNPKNHAETLVGVRFKTITDDGAPSYPKAFLLWNPAPLEEDSSTRREPTTDAIDALTKVILDRNAPLRTLTFIQSLGGVQRFDQLLRRALSRVDSPFKERVATFSSRSTHADRIDIQNKLISGEILHVTTTSALELGIDIGDLSCCLILGYPGTIASTLQEAGRVGRTGESLVIIMLRNDPFEQYFARAPHVFWEGFDRTEVPKVPIENKYLLTTQLLCAIWEGKQVGGYSESDLGNFFGASIVDVLKDLKAKGTKMYKEIRKGQAYWSFARGAPAKGEIYKNIRIPISEGKFDVIERTTKRKVGECDSHLVPRDLHPNAIWINNGEFYRSVEIKTKEATVYVDHIDEDDTYTFAMPRNTIKIEGKDTRSRKYDGFSAHCGDIDLKRDVYLYREVKFAKGKEELGEVKTTHTPSIEYVTSSLRIVFENEFVENYLRKIGKTRDDFDFSTALHGLEHSTHSVVPIISDFDPHDVSSEYVSNDANNEGKPALYLFDTFAGGLGLAEHCFNNLEEILQKARELLSTCNCRSGCPKCLVTPWCSQRNENIDKSATLHLIDMMLEALTNENSKTR